MKCFFCQIFASFLHNLNFPKALHWIGLNNVKCNAFGKFKLWRNEANIRLKKHFIVCPKVWTLVPMYFLFYLRTASVRNSVQHLHYLLWENPDFCRPKLMASATWALASKSRPFARSLFSIRRMNLQRILLQGR